MTKAYLLSLIFTVAGAYDLPPYFMAAIAEVESNWDCSAVNRNKDGSKDYGLMQINNGWWDDPAWEDPRTNIEAAAMLITNLRSYGLTWWQVAIAYNCGIGNMEKPPEASISYAAKVFEIWRLTDRTFSNYIGR